MKGLLLTSLILLLSLAPAMAQDEILVCQDSLFCIPSVQGMPRSKGIVIKREWVTNYGISSRAQTQGLSDGTGEVQVNRRTDLKLRFPILNKPGFKMAMGFNYFLEEYGFEDPALANYPFYNSIEDKNLRSLGASMFFVKPTKSDVYFLLRTKLSLNGDFRRSSLPTSDYLKFSVAPLIGWKRSPTLSHAVGFAYGYDFGKPSFYPVVVYNRTFSPYWGVEMLLPAYIKIRHNRSPRTIFYGEMGLNGASYNVLLSDTQFSENTTVHLHKSEVRFLLTLEQEIHDFLWFGASVGYRTNMQFSLNDGNNRDANVLIDNKLKGALIYNFSIFLVPPRQFLK